MTLYRGMDIGTAKPSAADRERVPHHLIDVLDPWESASVAWWLERAEAAAADIQARGKTALFVGGTPFYLKALLCGLFPSPPADQDLRRQTGGGGGTRGGGRPCMSGWPTWTRRRPGGCTRTTSAGWSGPWRSGT